MIAYNPTMGFPNAGKVVKYMHGRRTDCFRLRPIGKPKLRRSLELDSAARHQRLRSSQGNAGS